METLTVFMRPAPRLPKIMALAAIYWWWKDHIKSGNLEVVVKPLFEDEHPARQDGTWEYHLDCCGNGWRERGMKSELEVVMRDFQMTDDAKVDVLLAMAQAHNVRDSHHQNGARTTRNMMNKAWGSLGFFSGSAWALIGEVAEGLSQVDFIKMTVEVILESLEMDYAQQTGVALRPWSESDESQVIQKILGARYQGKPLSAGNFQFPTLSGYVYNLWCNGKSQIEIQAKLEPWRRLWRIIERKLQEAENTKPHHGFGLCHESREGVAFDFSSRQNARGVDNPLLHKGHLSQVEFVIVRKVDGTTGMFGRGFTDESMASLANALDFYEPGRWFYEGGSGIYNGSNSRKGILPSEIPVSAREGVCLVRLAQKHLRFNPPQRPQAARKH